MYYTDSTNFIPKNGKFSKLKLVNHIIHDLWDDICSQPPSFQAHEVCDETNRHRKTTVNFRCPAEWQSRSGGLWGPGVVVVVGDEGWWWWLVPGSSMGYHGKICGKLMKIGCISNIFVSFHLGAQFSTEP